jgi:hypothetical protein
LNYIIGDMPSALLRDTATVSVGAGGPGGDSVTIETTLIP